MKVAYCSDLHFEFSKPELFQFESDADVLILAGDIQLISRTIARLSDLYAYSYERDFFDYITGKYKHVLYVVGNHEFYDGDLTDIDKLRTSLKCYSNLTILDNESVTIDRIKFYGGTCWTDMNNDPLIYDNCKRMLNDFRLISARNGKHKFDFHDWLEQHQKFISNFDYSADVVISHHAPSMKCVHPMYENEHAMNTLYCSNLADFILDGNAKYWIHGHLHGSTELKIGDCQILCNSRGYPREQVFKTFKLETFDI